jgi:hypothetical protein
MDKIKEIEEEIWAYNINIEWSLYDDFRGSYFEFKFYKDLFKCELKCSKWDIEYNKENIIKIVIDYFDNCKMLLTSN